MFWTKKDSPQVENTGFSIQVLPSGEFLIHTHLANGDEPKVLSTIILAMIANHPEMVSGLCQSIRLSSQKMGWATRGNIVIEQVVNIHNALKVNKTASSPPPEAGDRNPVIKPIMVLPNLISKTN